MKGKIISTHRTIYFNPKVLQGLIEYSESNNITVNNTVNRAVKEYLGLEQPELVK
jgi:hypothetical protein